jgi:isoleucyl-tRNA synthetase
VPGWDCHGLPIELNVEKKHGKVGPKLTARAFRAACGDYASKQVDQQKADFQRLGVLADWDASYQTDQYRMEADTVRALLPLLEKGHLRRGQKPVHWCPLCASSLAEAEVEYQDKTSLALDVAFTVADADRRAFFNVFGLGDQPQADAFFPIWTTTPWTLPANQAVCLHPELPYVLVKQGDRFAVLAEALSEATLARWGWDKVEVIAMVEGAALVGMHAMHPWDGRQVPIIAAEHVTTEAGTGCVHTAPAHGEDDYRVGLQYGLPVETPVGAHSCFVSGTPHLEGVHVFKADEPVLALLHEHGRVLHQEAYQHSYPCCWRHKKPIIFRATAQWFVSMTDAGLRDAALASVGDVAWLPSWGEARMRGMLETRPDWCISRQRYWGTPLPLFLHQETGALHPDMPALLQRVAERIEQEGMDAWFESEVGDWLGEDAADYLMCRDTLDVWFDSGVTHASVLGARGLPVPSDLVLEGSDQHRGWFQTSLLTSMAMREEAPYRAVLTHGYVLDKDGYKLSKSKGNKGSVGTPDEVLKRYGADVLRWWVASSDFVEDVRISDEILKGASDAYRRIRNTARFLLSNLYDFNPETDRLPVAEMASLDQWVCVQAKALQARLLKAYDAFQFHAVTQGIQHFCIVLLGNFYLDVVKDRLYTAAPDSQARRSAQTALYVVLEAMVRWLAPVLSFTADEIWGHMPGKRDESVFLVQWYEAFYADVMASDVDWSLIQGVRDAVNKVLEVERKAGRIGSALDAKVVLYADASYLPLLSLIQSELRFVLICSQTEVHPLEAKGDAAYATDLPGLAVGVSVLKAAKCARCWQRRDDVGCHVGHEDVCGRCVKNMAGDGERRCFA